MQLDLNLLVALDALLEEGSVGGAADRLHLSAPAMSRTLGRIRKATGDPILVRTGRTMAPTPRALALRAEVHTLVERAQLVLTPDNELDLSTLDRTFTVQSHDAVITAVGAQVITTMHAQAPNINLRLLAEAPVDTNDLRQGRVDLEIGSITEAAPEIRVEFLAEDRIVGVVRPGHPLATGKVTAKRFANALHIGVSRRGRLTGPVDDALAEKGLTRRVIGTAPNSVAGLVLLRQADLVGMVAERLCRGTVEALGLHTFDIPVELPPLRVSQAWHHRYDADGAHAWLRGHLRDAIQDTCV